MPEGGLHFQEGARGQQAAELPMSAPAVGAIRGPRVHSASGCPRLPSFVAVGLRHFDIGAREYGEWSRAMLNMLGDRIKPRLEGIWCAMHRLRSQRA